MKRHLLMGLLAMALLGATRPASASGATGPQVHVVYAGQRLGSIAKRYNVTIEAICEANGIRRRDPIRPGQRLEIPSRGGASPKSPSGTPDAPAERATLPNGSRVDGKKPNLAAPSAKPKSSGADSRGQRPEAEATNERPSRAEVKSSKLGNLAANKSQAPVKTTSEPVLAAVADPAVVGPVVAGLSHRVRPGDSLSAIAVRYDTNVKTLLQVNKLSREQVIRVGQVLVIPRAPANSWWAKFARAPRRSGEMDVYAHTNRWKGKVVVNGKVQPGGRAALSRLLGATGSAPPLPERLIQLLAHVSDTFGGRPIRLVSGYRTNSYFKDSRHRHSSAVDFSIEGVPNSAVRDYLLQLGNVGVGYYPNSSFVHLDVRARSAYWVDYAGPGEAPRKTPRGDTRMASKARKLERKPTTRTPWRRVVRKQTPAVRDLHDLGRVASAEGQLEQPAQHGSSAPPPVLEADVKELDSSAAHVAPDVETDVAAPPTPVRARAKDESEPLAGRSLEPASGNSDATTTPTRTPGT